MRAVNRVYRNSPADKEMAATLSFEQEVHKIKGKFRFEGRRFKSKYSLSF